MADTTTTEQRVTDLENYVGDINVALQNVQSAAVVAPAATSTATSAAASSVIAWLGTQVVVQSDQGNYNAIGWTTFDASSSCPGASTLILEVQARRDFNVHGFCYAYARKDSGSQSVRIYGSDSAGTDSDTEGNLDQVLVPSSSGKFDFSCDAGLDNFTITIVGYFS